MRSTNRLMPWHRTTYKNAILVSSSGINPMYNDCNTSHTFKLFLLGLSLGISMECCASTQLRHNLGSTGSGDEKSNDANLHYQWGGFGARKVNASWWELACDPKRMWHKNTWLYTYTTHITSQPRLPNNWVVCFCWWQGWLGQVPLNLGGVARLAYLWICVWGSC